METPTARSLTSYSLRLEFPHLSTLCTSVCKKKVNERWINRTKQLHHTFICVLCSDCIKLTHNVEVLCVCPSVVMFHVKMNSTNLRYILCAVPPLTVLKLISFLCLSVIYSALFYLKPRLNLWNFWRMALLTKKLVQYIKYRSH